MPRGEYKPALADRIARSWRRRLSKIHRLSRLHDHVCDHLAMGRSPEQIAGRFRLEGPEHEISHGTASSTARKSTGRSATASWRGPRQNADGGYFKRRRELNPGRHSFHERSHAVDQHQKFGHWPISRIVSDVSHRRATRSRPKASGNRL